MSSGRAWRSWVWVSETVTTSLWIIPIAFVIGGTLLAMLVVALDRNYSFSGTPRYDPSTATSILAAMFGGLLTFAGFVITMLLLVPQFVSAQFSPRVLEVWYRQRELKYALGLIFGSLAYAFTVLRDVEQNYVPGLATSLAGILTLLSILFFLAFLGRFVHSLTPAALATSVARAGCRVIVRKYPEPFRPNLSEPAEQPEPLDKPDIVVQNSGEGRVIQAINRRALVTFARRHDVVLVLPQTVGEYVRSGAPLVELHLRGAGGGQRSIPIRRLEHLFVFGSGRTVRQDPAFALRILVDIASRALSPAVNDPTTAVQSIDRIEEMLGALAMRNLAIAELRDRQNRRRVILPTWSWEEYVHLGVREICHYGAAHPQVTRRLRAVLLDLIESVPERRRAAVEAELRLLDELVEQQFPDGGNRDFATAADKGGIGPGERPKPAGSRSIQ